MERPKLDTLFLAYRTSGDATALAQVFDLAAPELYELARRLSPDRSAAEDVLQDTFVTAIEKRASWDEREPLLPWLIGILAIASQRRRRERARTPDPVRVTQAQVERPDEALEASERHRQLLAALAALKPSERSLVEQRLLEGCSPHEMARELGLTSATLRMRISRALARLRRAAPASLSWVLLPSWPSQKALASVRLRLIPNVPATAPMHASMKLVAGVFGTLTLAGAAVIVACLGPEKPAAPPASAAATPSAASITPPPVVTIGAPPPEGDIVALNPAPDAPRKRLHLVVDTNGKALAHATLVRLFPDAGFEGFWPGFDALGRIDVDVITAQPPIQLCIEAQACKREYFVLDPAQLTDGETRRIELVPGPEHVQVRFVHPCSFPTGFAASFISLSLLGDRRPEPAEIGRHFLKELNHFESRTTLVEPNGAIAVPILPGRYWVWANPNNVLSGQQLEFPSCCFEVEVPEGRACEIFYLGDNNGAVALDVLGPSTSGVTVTLEDAGRLPRTLWFRIADAAAGANYTASVNVAVTGSRSEPIPEGEHTLVFRRNGKEIERRTVTIVRGEELKLSISP